MPRDGILEALDQAIGSSKIRRRESVFILSELTDMPEVVERIGLRAAQALCDIYDWPFEWNKAYVAETVARVKRELK